MTQCCSTDWHDHQPLHFSLWKILTKLILNHVPIPIEKDGLDSYIHAASQLLQTRADDLSIIEILSKSLDPRNQEQFYYILSLVVLVADTYDNSSGFPLYIPSPTTERKMAGSKERPIIVGFGPAGMFAALELVDAGLKPLIFERGKKIEERTLDVQKFMQERELNNESNIQFGEGGAGSYSDGKLFSRRNNNTGPVHRVLQAFIRFGAPAEIAYISKPHLGTDVLCRIVRKIRTSILERGGEIFYEAKMTDLLMAGDAAAGIIINERAGVSWQQHLSGPGSFSSRHPGDAAGQRGGPGIAAHFSWTAD